MAGIMSVTEMRSKGAWIDPTIRAVLMAARPWSIPASLVPAVLAAMLVAHNIYDIPRALGPIFVGLLVHLAANCTNTLYDFSKGLDNADTADDRALVDATVGQSTLWILSAFFFTSGAALAGHAVYTAGPDLLGPVAAGFALAFFYTADPLSLKYLGLGDITVFLCFGPLLMVSVSGAVTGTPLTVAALVQAARMLDLAALGPHASVLLMSIPIGLLTANILHANNVRDLPLDRSAGAHTLAGAIGLQASKAAFTLVFAAAYATAVLAEAYHLLGRYSCTYALLYSTVSHLSVPDAVALILGNSGAGAVWAAGGPSLACAMHIARAAAFLALTLPWCVSLVGRMARNELATLPQAVAQFDLLFGALVVSGLLPLMACARLWLGILFYLGGVNNLLMWHHTALLVRSKLSTATGLGSSLPSWFTSAAGLTASFVQMGASVVFILGVPGWTRPSAAVLLAFLLPVTVTVHDLWNSDHDGPGELRYPAATSVEEYKSAMGKPAEVSSAPHAGPAPLSHTPASQRAALSLRKRRGPSPAVSLPTAGAWMQSQEPISPSSYTPASSGRGKGQRSPSPSRLGRVMAHPPSLPGTHAVPVLAVPTFLDDFSNEFVHFFKNCGMAGGLMLVMALAGDAIEK